MYFIAFHSGIYEILTYFAFEYNIAILDRHVFNLSASSGLLSTVYAFIYFN